MIRLKRAYEPTSKEDGHRVLVERLWPRGISKQKARLDLWMKEIAPSTELRTWYGHEPAKWAQFQRRYRAELRLNPAVKEMRRLIKEKRAVTFVYAARDEKRNSTVVLKAFLGRK